MKRKESYAGQLPALPMVIPRDTCLVLYGPVGSVQATMIPRKGQAPWVIDFTPYGQDTQVPVIGDLWGLAYASGEGTIQYVYQPVEWHNPLRFDTINPLLVSQTLPATGTSGGLYNSGLVTITVPVVGNVIWHITACVIEIGESTGVGPGFSSELTSLAVFKSLGTQSQVPFAVKTGLTQTLQSPNTYTILVANTDQDPTAVPGGAAVTYFKAWDEELLLVAGEQLIVRLLFNDGVNTGDPVATMYLTGWSEPLGP